MYVCMYMWSIDKYSSIIYTILSGMSWDYFFHRVFFSTKKGDTMARSPPKNHLICWRNDESLGLSNGKITTTWTNHTLRTGVSINHIYNADRMGIWPATWYWVRKGGMGAYIDFNFSLNFRSMNPSGTLIRIPTPKGECSINTPNWLLLVHSFSCLLQKLWDKFSHVRVHLFWHFGWWKLGVWN